jgi:hypothetical protein
MARRKKLQVFEPIFYPVGHIYEMPDGTRLDSVTQILKSELGLWQYGNNEAAERGTDLHKLCQFLDEGRLDFSKVKKDYRPYVASYFQAKEDLKINIVQNEIARYHGIYLFAGTLDKVGTVDGKPYIFDLKTGAKNKSYKWQLAAYRHLFAQETGELWPAMCLYVSPDGYSVDIHDDENDWLEFLALMSAFNVKKKYGYSPKNKGE